MIEHNFSFTSVPKEFENGIEKLASLYMQKAGMLNFTAAQTKEEIINRHLLDALIVLEAIKLYNSDNIDNPFIADAGAGGGFIGFALKVFMPQAKITEIESVQRKCAFMNWLILKMSFSDAAVLNTRAEYIKGMNADIVAERAMGQIGDIAKTCLSLVKPGGLFLAYQGESSRQSDVEEAIKNLDASVKARLNYKLADNAQRFLYVIEKN